MVFFSGIALKKVEQKQEADKAAAAGAGGSSGGKGGPGGHGTDVASILARRRAVEVTIWISIINMQKIFKTGAILQGNALCVYCALTFFAQKALFLLPLCSLKTK